MPFAINPAWSFREFLDHLFAYYRGGGIEGTGYRLNAMRNWLSMAGRTRALAALAEIERAAETSDKAQIAESLWMAERSWRALIKFAQSLPNEDTEQKKAIRAFVSYKWQAGKHVAWVRRLSADLRARGIEAILDQWEVRLGESFTDFMQENIATADVILFVITPEAVKAAEAPKGKGGALKFEVQMMNARRMAEGTRIIGIYRAGKRPPRYLRDHRYIDFRDDENYESSLLILVDDILGRGGAPRVTRT
jgi:hypothetical protein